MLHVERMRVAHCSHGPDRGGDDAGAAALATTAVIKLNGGLGTTMGLDRAKTLIIAREGLTFLDIIARQVLTMRHSYRARLPLIWLNSFPRRPALRRQARHAARCRLHTGVRLQLRQPRRPSATTCRRMVRTQRRATRDRGCASHRKRSQGGHFALRKRDRRIVLRETAHTLLCEAARQAGAIGARITGGGFGGSAIVLVPAELADDAPGARRIG